MGKPYGNQPKRSKDSFFISKKQHRSDYDRKSQAFGQKPTEANTSSGSFFISSTEKDHILKERESKKSFRQKFQSDRTQRPERVQAPKEENKKPKKEFDKKKWRLQKYSKKYKLQQWEDKRKKAVLNEYYRELKDDGPKLDVQKIYEKYGVDDDENNLGNKQEENENENNLNKDINEAETSITWTEEGSENVESQPNTSQTRKNKAFKKAHIEFQRIQEEKKQKKGDFLIRKAEKAEALKQYKQKKLEKYKKLNKKTKKGQPIMKYRMEMLLEQIQKSVQ